MTEKDLFRTTLITLGSTIVLPLIVGVSGLAAPGDKPTNDLIKSYVGTSAVKTEESKDTAKTDEAKPTDQNKSTDQAQSSDTPKTDAAVPAAGAAPAKAAGSYTVKAGDTYGCIAEHYYGSYDQWPKVYNANAGWPGFNEYDLAVGASLQMPAVSAAEALPKTDLCK